MYHFLKPPLFLVKNYEVSAYNSYHKEAFLAGKKFTQKTRFHLAMAGTCLK